MKSDKQKKKEIKREWYCWYCGKPLDFSKEVMLWSLNDRIDRVFMVCDNKKCQEITQAGQKDMLVARVKSKI